MPSTSASPGSSWKPIRWWNATEPGFTEDVTARTRTQPRASAAWKNVSWSRRPSPLHLGEPTRAMLGEIQQGALATPSIVR